MPAQITQTAACSTPPSAMLTMESASHFNARFYPTRTHREMWVALAKRQTTAQETWSVPPRGSEPGHARCDADSFQDCHQRAHYTLTGHGQKLHGCQLTPVGLVCGDGGVLSCCASQCMQACVMPSFGGVRKTIFSRKLCIPVLLSVKYCSMDAELAALSFWHTCELTLCGPMRARMSACPRHLFPCL